MTKHRDLAFGNAFPESFVDALTEFISTYISPNTVVSIVNATTVQVSATTVDGQVCLGVNGRWRWITSNVQATDPGGAAAVHALWATASDNSFAIGPPEVDSTNYTFALAITTGAAPVGPALARQIGYVEWNGSAITNARLLLDDSATRGTLEPGDLIWSASSGTRNGALLCDGASYLRTTWPALFNALGGTSSPWGLPDGTHFNVPDLRGRVPIGVGTGAGLTARALAALGGVETYQLSAAESGVPAHTHPSGGAASGSTGTGVTGTGATGTAASGGTESALHTHQTTGGFLLARTSTLVGAGGLPAFSDDVGTFTFSGGNESVVHTHSTPSLSVPSLSVPSLSVSVTDPATPANSPAGAASAHQNMQPFVGLNVYVKT